jgi:CubicO group peptidase (beta-lactamase class C family)
MLPLPLVSAAWTLATAAPVRTPVNDTAGLARRAPVEVAMDPERLALIDRVVTRGLDAGGFPGAAVVVGRRGAIVWERGYGHLDWQSSATVDAERTVYDLASLTKVIATSTAAMVLVDRHRLRLDDRVGKYIPEFRRGDKAQVTVRDLLAHRSGLPAGRDLGARGRGAAAARRVALATPLASPPGTRTEYSDIGADVLGFVVEAVAGEPLDRFVRRTVYAKLGMRSTLFRPPATLRPRTAPTELYPPRGYPLRGEVHDENAYALGGIAGHAGLFSTASDLSIFAQMMLNGGEYRGVRVLSDSIVELFTRRAAGSRALGWDTCSGGGSCGRVLGPRAYGHTGYTGTSIWIDPDRELFVIVLTNWVHAHPGGLVAPIAVLADVRSDIADIAALSVTDLFGTPQMPAKLRSEMAIGWWR